MAIITAAGFVSHWWIGRDVEQLEQRHAAWLARPIAELRARNLNELVAQLHAQSGCRIEIDSKALADAKITGEEPLQQLLFDLPLERAMGIALAQIETPQKLAWQWRGETIIISTAEAIAYASTTLCVYDVRDLIGLPEFNNPNDQTIIFDGPPNPPASPVGEQLIRLIENSVAVETWRDAGGTIGSINLLDGRLMITQTAENQSKVAELLTKLRESPAPSW